MQTIQIDKYRFMLLLLGAFALEAAGYIAFPYISLQLKEQYGLSVRAIGVVLLFAIWIRPLASLVGGYAANKITYLKIFSLACLAESFCFFALGLAKSAPIAILAVVIGNIGFSIWTPNLFALVNSWYPSDQQFHRIAKLNGVINAGAAFGCLVGALASQVNTQSIFIITGAAYLLALPILGFTLAGEKAAANTILEPKLEGKARYLTIIVLSLVTLTFWSSYSQFNSFFSIFANDWLNSKTITGVSFGAVAIGVSLVSYWISRFKLNPNRFSLLTLFSAAGLALGWIVLTGNKNYFSTGIFIITIIFSEAFFSIFLADVWASTNIGGFNQRQGVNFTLRNVGMGVGSYLGGVYYNSPEFGTLAKWGVLNEIILIVLMVSLSIVIYERSKLV